MLSGEINAILDYRYFAGPSLTWYFDHHKTAFLTEEDHAHFHERIDSGRFFFDAGYTSCTKLIADIGREHFDLETAGLEELIDWADLVDSAAFASAEEAIDRKNPIMRMVSVVEQHGHGRFLEQLVADLDEKPLREIAASDLIESRFKPLGKKHARFIERVRECAVERGRVVYVDMTDAVAETVGKFVTYALYPKSTYSVIVGRMSSGAKISVGYNPWSGHPLDTDISAICKRYGGGGHAAVGGIAYPLKELEKAISVADGIARELGG